MALLSLSPPHMMVMEGLLVLEMPRNHPALNVGVHTLCATNQDDSRPTGIFKICVRLIKGTEKLAFIRRLVSSAVFSTVPCRWKVLARSNLVDENKNRLYYSILLLIINCHNLNSTSHTLG